LLLVPCCVDPTLFYVVKWPIFSAEIVLFPSEVEAPFMQLAWVFTLDLPRDDDLLFDIPPSSSAYWFLV